MQNSSYSHKDLKVDFLFPKPVILSNIGIVNQEEKIYLDELEWMHNIGNKISKDRNILNNDILKNIRSSIENCLEKTLRMIYDPVCDVSLYITQSWVNYSLQGMYHHKHTHANSFLSGVYYVQADKEKDKIIFYNEEYSMIKLPANSWNQFNSNSWFYPVESGDLIIFPSSIMHGVNPVETNNRISIGFNTFLKGSIGDDSVSFNLKLKVANLS